MPIQNAKFICACPKHGVDVHDGSKNECCDTAVVLPALSVKDVEQLNSEGQKMYKEDVLKLAHFVESGAIELPQVAAEWYKNEGFPLIENDVNKPKVEDAEPIDANDHQEEPMDFNPDAYYMAGFESGFALGYEKGFDAGNRLSVLASKK